MKNYITILIALFALFTASAVMAEDYTICGRKLKDGETITAVIPVGGIVAKYEKKYPGGQHDVGGIYVPSITTDDGVMFCSSIVSTNKGIPTICSEATIGQVQLGKTIAIRTSMEFPLLRIEILSVNFDQGYIRVEITKNP